MVLNGDQRIEAVRWIREFACYLSETLRSSNIKELFVIINKYDKCHSYYKDLENDVDKELAKALQGVIGEVATKLKIYPCILIRNKNAERLLSSIISDIAFTLRRKKRTLG